LNNFQTIYNGLHAMKDDSLVNQLLAALEDIPLIDPHSHIDPRQPVSRSLDDILGYHYYTELAHSVGMPHAPLHPAVSARERVRAIVSHMERFDNTVQSSWFSDIAREFLGWQGEYLSPQDVDAIFDTAHRIFNQPDWEDQVFRRSRLEQIFLTNEFDDDLTGFDTHRYVPCLRTDTLVFRGNEPDVQRRLAQVTGVEVGDWSSWRRALGRLFERFVSHGAKACAISLPPDFAPSCPESQPVFWMLAEFCRDFQLPFDLMIGVNRRVYEQGVYQGQDLFDHRCSLLAYRQVFNAFPTVTFCISVLSSGLNQELVSHAWIFPNVVTFGHWWYSNVPAYIESDLRARLQAVPKTKQIGYYSDAYKLEFVLPKYRMYRRCLARLLADDFVRTRRLTESQAVELGYALLRGNVERLFRVGSH
jgi:glucuronate isomerase